VSVPLSGIVLGTLPQSELGNASGLYNLLRNIGGSVGISVANTITQRHLQTHRNENVASDIEWQPGPAPANGGFDFVNANAYGARESFT
jgi:hypothetical protein